MAQPGMHLHDVTVRLATPWSELGLWAHSFPHPLDRSSLCPPGAQVERTEDFLETSRKLQPDLKRRDKLLCGQKASLGTAGEGHGGGGGGKRGGDTGSRAGPHPCSPVPKHRLA